MDDTTPGTARLTVDVVVIGWLQGHRRVLLIERGWAPFAGYLALPGGHVDLGENPEPAARRELTEETGLQVEHLDPIGVYAAPGRDPRGRYVSFAYAATVPTLAPVVAGDDAVAARWVPVLELPDLPIAFDHARIIRDVLTGRRGGDT